MTREEEERERERKERTHFECKLERAGERGQQTSQGRAGAGNYGANPATLRRHEPLLVL